MPSLDWIGKASILNHHNEIPYRLVECNEVIGDLNAGNLIVKGDNLHALKALLPYYKGKVKLIYIDPPYNTGNEGWVYNDAVNSPEIKEWLGRTVGQEAEDLCRHDKWLNMIYPRLKLLKEFLSEDGSIWISIDDNEVHHLRTLMDEIFGVKRFIACNVWQKRYSRENREAIGDVHEYIVVYAMNPTLFKQKRNRIPFDEKQAKVYKNLNNDPKGRWRGIPMTAQAGHATAEQFYEIISPAGKVFRPSEGRCWSLSKATYEKFLSEGKIYFGKDGKSQPNVIRYLSEVQGVVPWTWWPHEEVGHTDEASKELLSIFAGTSGFNTTPKPTRLIRRILQIASNPGDIIMDSFAGSGTTAHAILAQNNEDNGQRKFVLVEMEDYARDITAERVKRVMQGYGSTLGIGGGFRYCELGEPIKDENGALNPEVSAEALAKHFFFSEYGVPLETKATLPYIGSFNASGLYLFFDTFERKKLAKLLKDSNESRIVYAASCTIDPQKLKDAGITFRQLPFEIKDR